MTLTAQKFDTAAQARKALTDAGYRCIPFKWWQNDAVPGAASCLVYSQAPAGHFYVWVP